MLSNEKWRTNTLDSTYVIAQPYQDPLQWWAVQHINFPRVAAAARKWLCVIATSTASERAFSSCGLARIAKRSRCGRDEQHQILVKKNMDAIQMSQDEVCRALTTEPSLS